MKGAFAEGTQIPSRTLWHADDDYEVLVHRAWTSRAKSLRPLTLKHHPQYWPAKKYGDYIAAQNVVDDLINEDSLLALCSKIPEGSRPLIVAPSLTASDPTNVIPIWFAYNLAYHLDLQVCRNIFQSGTGSGSYLKKPRRWYKCHLYRWLPYRVKYLL